MFHAHKLALASLLICLFAKGVSAGLILQGNDAAHIALGNQFAAVGAVQGTNSANVTGLAQSMSLIQPQWGLASKHGFLDSANGNSLYTNLRVSFDGNFQTANTWYNIAEVFLHPTKDMAIMRFEVPVQNITPVSGRFKRGHS